MLRHQLHVERCIADAFRPMLVNDLVPGCRTTTHSIALDFQHRCWPIDQAHELSDCPFTGGASITGRRQRIQQCQNY